MFVINPQGTLIYGGAIDSINSTDQEDISKATNYVQQALDEALNQKPVTLASTKAYGCGVHY
jgi:sensor domain CHASE-containing protein